MLEIDLDILDTLPAPQRRLAACIFLEELGAQRESLRGYTEGISTGLTRMDAAVAENKRLREKCRAVLLEGADE